MSPNKSSRRDKNKAVFEQFQRHALTSVTDETRDYLRNLRFDNWKFDDAEMLILLQQMFIDLDLTTHFSIKVN